MYRIHHNASLPVTNSALHHINNPRRDMLQHLCEKKQMMKTLRQTIMKAAALLFIVPAAQAQTVNTNAWSNYDTYIQQRMNEWNIPGMAIVVVKGDSVVLKKTYGYSDVAAKTKVTPQTLFAIGSCTKFFTATAVSILTDENKLDPDSPVISYYPQLQLKDSLLRKEILVKDILSHRTGLERGDYIWYGAGYSGQEVLDRLKYLEPVAPLRDAFIYNNMMYTLAGALIEKQSSMPYSSFVAKRLLQPLKMTSTVFDLSAAGQPHALPYSFSGSMYRQLPLPQLKGVEPAGGIWSNLDDMTQWLTFHLRTGKADTAQILSVRAMKRLKTPVLFTGSGMREDETEYKSYGMGMGFTAYKGHRVMYHTGVAGGYTAHIAFLPEENTGIMILTNTETYTFALVNNIFDRMLGTEQTDWNSPVLAAVKEQWQEDEKDKNEHLLKIKNAAPIEKAAAYAGTYSHRYCRSVMIWSKKNKLFLTVNAVEYPLVQLSENEFMAYDEQVYGEITVMFNRDAQQVISGLQLKLMGETLEYKK